VAYRQAKESIVSIGTVKWFDSGKGYGFITPDSGGNDLFVHHSEVKTTGYATLEINQKVNFEAGQGKKGPCATNVTLYVKASAPVAVKAAPAQLAADEVILTAAEDEIADAAEAETATV
jgi:CspA family cold shock protein